MPSTQLETVDRPDPISSSRYFFGYVWDGLKAKPAHQFYAIELLKSSHILLQSDRLI